MKKITLFTLFTFFSVMLLTAQSSTLLKIDGDGVLPKDGKCYPANSDAENANVFLRITDEVSYAQMIGAGRVQRVDGGKLGNAIQSQYLFLATSPRFWYLGPISTKGCTDVSISSFLSGMATSSGTGAEPAKNWRFQYCVGSAETLKTEATWLDLPNNEFSLTQGVWTEVSFNLPAACENQDAISFRWQHVGSEGINGGAASGSGWARIDEIEVKAVKSTSSIKENKTNMQVTVNGKNISVKDVNGSYNLIAIDGTIMSRGKLVSDEVIVASQSGVYILKIITAKGKVLTEKINIV